MIALYIVSSQKGDGKTTIAAGLGKRLLGEGKRVGFLKPVIGDFPATEDSDAAFMKRIFALKEPIESLSPVFADENSVKSNIKEAYARVAGGKDIVIVECEVSNSVVREMLKALGGKVTSIASYSEQLVKAAENARAFGNDLAGVVVNKVPKTRLDKAREDVAGQFTKAGVKVLGILPEDRTLLAPTVSELASQIGGVITSGADKSGELVESLMLGAKTVDSGLTYFARKPNKAAILRAERLDMQLAALETPTRCLVITGEGKPRPPVMAAAEDRNVPVVLAREEPCAIIQKIEEALASSKFNQESKLPKLAEIIGKLDYQTLKKELGLAG